MSRSQLPLNFEPKKVWDELDFLVTECNEEAASLVKTWPEWQSHAAVIFGPPGSGKSHLAGIWQGRSAARAMKMTDLTIDVSKHRSTSLLVEDVDRGDFDERALFHSLNLAREHGTFVLLTGRTAPGQWPILLPDLRSRIRSYPAVAIKEPDDELLATVLVKHFSDRQLSVAPDVIPFILSRMERSMAAAQDLAARIDMLALSLHRKVTRALAAEVIREESARGQHGEV